MINDTTIPQGNKFGLSEELLKKLSDERLLSMYSETKEFIDSFGMPNIIDCLCELAPEHMFAYKTDLNEDISEENEHFEQIREKTQLIFGLINYMTGLDNHVKSVVLMRKPSI